MPCYRPLIGYRSFRTNPNGKRNIVFNKNEGFSDLEIKLPCGQCIGCKLERSRQWAIRCMHESTLHKHNSFITLTYNNDHLPKNQNLNKKHFQDFMKRLRKTYGAGIRFFHCGEYGDKKGRPHYHACIFGLEFKDKKIWKIHKGQKYYTSESLEKLWPFGFSTIGDVTFQSAAYVARYITKKITGKNAFLHYNKIDLETGEILREIQPEYTTMSRRPGIGKDWLTKYTNDVYNHDFIIINGKKIKPPKYYDRQYEILNPEKFSKIKRQRVKQGKNNLQNSTTGRLITREIIHNKKGTQLIRGYDNEN